MARGTLILQKMEENLQTKKHPYMGFFLKFRYKYIQIKGGHVSEKPKTCKLVLGKQATGIEEQ